MKEPTFSIIEFLTGIESEFLLLILKIVSWRRGPNWVRWFTPGLLELENELEEESKNDHWAG